MLMNLYRKHGAATICALYIILSLIWIAGSDMLVGGLTSNVDVLSTLQTIKGFGFVGLTGLGLFYLVRLHQKHLMTARETADKWVEKSFRQAHRPMCLVDPASLRIADANPRAQEYLGIDIDDLKTMELANLFKSDTISRTSKTTTRETIVHALRSDAEQPELLIKNRGAVDTSCKVEVANIVLGEQPYIRLSLIDTTRSRIFESVMRDLSKGLASETRADFHQSLAQSLSRNLGVDCVFVGELEAKNKEERIVTTAFVQNGQIIDNKAFNKQGTPCEQVISLGKPLVVTEAPQSYPDAPRIVDLDLVSYHRNAPSVHQQHLADGRWIEIGTYPIEDGGRVLLRADITKRREMEAALRHSEERFRTLIDEANQGIIVHKDLRPEYCNPAFAAMFGYDSVDEILALDSIEPLIDEADLKRLRGYNDERIAGKETPDAYEFTGIMNDGNLVPIRSQAILVPWNDDYAICANMFDMSEQREAEASREIAEKALRRSQRMEAVGLLTGGIAHDFNNLLGIIMGNLEFVQRMIGDNEVVSRRVANALTATTRGSQLTRRLLNFSSQEPKPGQPTNADVVIAGLEEMLAKSLTSEIELEFHPTDDLWLTEIDPGDLGDAVLNLVLNARDAMPSGGRLVIETENRFLNGNEADREIRGADMDSGDYVVVTVSDNGIGMAPDLIDKVQEPLFTTKPEGRGTGLGLSMVYAFAKRSRGQVRIYSEPGHGTTVHLFLPRAHASEQITALETWTKTAHF